ncbi:hypothetical protein Sru01_36870 [Sphaerisporangium rufum]|uniref:Membrane protein involved in the export of O-antigen and teichoic acid n=1 Tax=Sphaerisporangium rufum TaxID=1381558 RepID=A0A919V5V4_9ACTN|nr:polysaccharide biosynthesis C-terminal domain-containing protein [Sphaerisporangium rufum]GII78705.1 hypothetical protein Sru01_36870 [Sphaerisporangium rufum]
MTIPARGVARTVARRALRVVLASAANVLIAHALRPDGRGHYAVITTVAFTGIVIGHFSVERTQISLWERAERRQALSVNAPALGLAAGTAAAVLGGVLALLGALPARPALLLVALLAVPFGAVTVNLTAIALLRARVELVNRSAIAAGAVQCGSAAVLAATGRLTLPAAILCWTVAMIVPAPLLARALRPLPPRAFDPRLARHQLRVAARYHPGLVAFHLLLIIDVLLLHARHSPAAAGVYAIAVGLLELTRIPGESVAQVALARQAADDLPAAALLTARAVRLGVVLSCCSAGLLALASPLLIPLVYGRAFAGAVAPLAVLAPGMVALIAMRPLEQHLVRLGRPVLMTSIALAALAANVLLNLALIPPLGATGAALVSCATYICMAVAEAAWFLGATGLAARELLPRRADLAFAGRAVRAGLRRAAERRVPRRAAAERDPVR